MITIIWLVEQEDRFDRDYYVSLTLFHVTPLANLFYVGGGGERTPPSNFVIFKDRDLKFDDNVH